MKIYYVDTARTGVNGKKRQKSHTVFDGGRVFKVMKLTELGDAGEVFIDSIYPENYREVLELLKKNVRVYVLRNTAVLKKLRLENGVKKSDENDALILSRIPRDNYRLLSVEELELKVRVRPLINRYEKLTRWHKTVKTWLRYCDIPIVSEMFKQSIRLLEKSIKETSREIVNIVRNSNNIYGQTYREVAKSLYINDSVVLAILVLETPLYLNTHKLKTLYGYTPNKNNGRYDRRLRGLNATLANNIYVNVKKGRIRNDKFREYVEKMSKRKAKYKIGVEVLKTMRRTFVRITNKVLETELLADER